MLIARASVNGSTLRGAGFAHAKEYFSVMGHRALRTADSRCFYDPLGTIADQLCSRWSCQTDRCRYSGGAVGKINSACRGFDQEPRPSRWPLRREKSQCDVESHALAV